MRIGLAIPACIAILVLAVLWDYYPPSNEPCFIASAPDVVQPYGLAHCYREPSAFELFLRAAIPLIALAAVAALVALTAHTRKIITGASATAASALLGLVLVHMIVSRTIPISYVPSAASAAIVVIASFVFGAAVAWGASKRWPNTSLERTRER